MNEQTEQTVEQTNESTFSLQGAEPADPTETGTEDMVDQEEQPEGEPTQVPEADPPAELTDEETAKYTEEYQQSGNLGEESRAAIKQKFGVNDAMIDVYLAGLGKAQADQVQAQQAETSKLMEIVGGAEGWDQMKTWAAGALSDAEKAAFEKTMQGSDPAMKEFVLRSLVERHKSTLPSNPPTRTVEGTRGSGNRLKPYESKAQVHADMRNPKYDADPAFRAKVQKRLSISKL